MHAILNIGLLGNGRGLIGPRDNSRHVEGRRCPSSPVIVGDLSAELRGDICVIESDFLLDDALVPDGMKVRFAWPLDRNQVATPIIVKRDVLRLMNIANPMSKAL